MPDYPGGHRFIDITTVLQDAEALHQSITEMKKLAEELGDFDMIVGPESRGFIFGAPLAYAMGKGFAPIRKKGKLPYKTVGIKYELEYGTDELEIHEDAIAPGQRVLIVDDLLATGTQSNEAYRELGQGDRLVFFVGDLPTEGKRGYEVKSVVKI